LFYKIRLGKIVNCIYNWDLYEIKI